MAPRLGLYFGGGVCVCLGIAGELVREQQKDQDSMGLEGQFPKPGVVLLVLSEIL